MRSVVSIEVRAPAATVFALVCDPERWARILPHYRSVRVLRRDSAGRTLARYTAVRTFGPAGAFSFPIVWRSWSWSNHDRIASTLHFHHAGGATAGMDVIWRIEPHPAGCRVRIEHVFRRRLPIPILGRAIGDEAFPRLVDAFVVRPIATRTLEAVRAMAEAIHDVEPERRAAPRSDR